MRGDGVESVATRVRDFLTAEDRGVTPVVGVVLIVALAVVLAGLIGQYVFGLDIVGSQESGPQVSFETEYNNSEVLTIRHNGGDKLENANETLTVSVTDNPHPEFDHGNDVHIPEGDMTSNDAIVVEDLRSDAQVLVVWQSSTTDDSYVIFDWDNYRS